MKKIETTITRDLSLIDIRAWHSGYTTGMQKWLGWSYSDSVFYIHDGYTEIMRPPEEHLIGFRDKVFSKIDSDENWFGKESDRFDNLVKEIYVFFDESNRKIDEAPDPEIAQIYKKYVDYISCAMCPFVVMFWLPVWLENDIVRKEKYAKEIEIAIAYRKKTEHLFPGGAELTNKILSRVSKETKIDNHILRVLSGEELTDYLIGGIRPDTEELKERIKGFVYSKKGIILTDNTTENFRKVINGIGYDFVVKKHGNIKELKGQVACGGKVRGKVRIIMSKKDIGTLEDGEILITAMTTPEYLPAMHKSAAFVTDEGGITCHAAIVARELKKPCIIGTKNATKVFKDGDMVEVDADKGIVKVIE
ncbi:MAG: PEP-utilizing enzyme [Candidatus Paceibacterota bacterium]|jgi:phosphoenolpyruvate synthase/pyruvate phosphate dikinase